MAVSEAWRDVPGYGGKYQASDMGRIANTFWHGRRRQNGGRTIMAQFKKKPHGNARESAKRFVHLTDLEGNRKEISAAKVVAETFLGPVPPGMAIFHKNGNPAAGAEIQRHRRAAGMLFQCPPGCQAELFQLPGHY